jgi:hypothetical protein
VTATTDPVRDFREALPAHIRAQLYDTQRAAGLITAAIGRGWTVPALTAECSRSLAGVVNAGGVITSRLEHCAHNDPPVKAPKARPVWCGQCDLATRHVLDENRLPAAARCPHCHPLASQR